MATRSEYPHGVPCWVDLGTSDESAAEQFYTELFGWEWEAAAIPGGGGYRMATKAGERVAGLSAPPPDQAGHPPAWTTWISVTEVADAAARAEANGARIVVPPFGIPGHGSGTIVTDPAGAVFGLWQPDGHPGAGVTDEHGTVVWHELLTPNTGGAVAFYGALFGWVSGTMEFPPGSTYTTLFQGIETVGGTAPPPAGTPPQWRVWFGSEDVAATLGLAEELGATVAVPLTESPIGSFAHLVDPSGAPFNVIAAG